MIRFNFIFLSLGLLLSCPAFSGIIVFHAENSHFRVSGFEDSFELYFNDTLPQKGQLFIREKGSAILINDQQKVLELKGPLVATIEELHERLDKIVTEPEIYSWISATIKRESKTNNFNRPGYSRTPTILLPYKSLIQHKTYRLPFINRNLVDEVEITDIFNQKLPFEYLNDSLIFFDATEINEELVVVKASSDLQIQLYGLKFQSSQDSVNLQKEIAYVNSLKEKLSEELYFIILAEMYLSYSLYCDFNEMYFYAVQIDPEGRKNLRKRWLISIVNLTKSLEK